MAPLKPNAMHANYIYVIVLRQEGRTQTISLECMLPLLLLLLVVHNNVIRNTRFINLNLPPYLQLHVFFLLVPAYDHRPCYEMRGAVVM